MDKRVIYRVLIVLILFSTVIRLFLAGFLELGNDEVYYWTYALYPDLSHFDHPPMVGWIIQLFTLNLVVEHELFLRLGSVILASVNIYIIFLIGKKIKNEMTGLIAAFLYTGSIYGFLISGTFILPDTPQMFFWFLSLYFFLLSQSGDIRIKSSWYIIIMGIMIGAAMISKYTSVFLWFGFILFFVFYRRKWFKKISLYVAILISALIIIPVLIWNIQNDWISFTYQGERVNFFGSGLNADYFFTEIGGQIFYNNPVNFIIIIISLIALLRKRQFLDKNWKRILLLTGLPIIILFILFSLFRQTLPHWSAPGYTSLIIIASAYLDEKNVRKRLLPIPVIFSLLFLLIILVLGIGQVKGGWLFSDSNAEPTELGKDDVSLDMYGWRNLSAQFEEKILDTEKYRNFTNDPIISHRWFPAANLDYYVARPLNMKVLAIGQLDKIHKYAWINRERGGFREGMDAWFITLSTDYEDPSKMYGQYFKSIFPVDTLRISRGKKKVVNVFVFRMINLEKLPADVLK